MTELNAGATLRHTPLHAMHIRLGARMVPFAGYEMPVQYPSGVIKEHLHTRAAAGLFDVSHMGQITLRPKSGRLADVALALESFVPADIAGLAIDRQRYTMFTNAAGGVIDDLMVSNRGDHLLLVVNAARKAVDAGLLRASLPADCLIEVHEQRALLALQGPLAEEVLSTLTPDVRSMRFMDVRSLTLLGKTCTVARSGYTGEDGFEICTGAETAAVLWEALLRDPAVAPIGLGARDSLRLEAGLCLYGADLDETTSPIEAALEWTIPNVRRPGGAREGIFPGAEVILDQLDRGVPRRRVGLRPEGRAPVRAGAPLFLAAPDEAPCGSVTSGGFGVSLNAPVAMGFVPTANAIPGTRLFTEVRGKRLPLAVSALPFVPRRYKRA